jgi:hypothetical protein
VRRTQRAKQLPSYKAAKSLRLLTSSAVYSAGLLLRTKLTPLIDASKGHAGAAILVEYVELITAPFEMFYEL